jgi:hypothetical protein
VATVNNGDVLFGSCRMMTTMGMQLTVVGLFSLEENPFVVLVVAF